MKGLATIILVVASMVGCTCSEGISAMIPKRIEAGEMAQKAWAAWRDGEVTEAEKLAIMLPGTSEIKHLLFLCCFVKGKYEAALEHYEKIRPSYDKFSNLDEPVIYAYFHLHRYTEAVEFARRRNMEERRLLKGLDMYAKTLLKVSLNKTMVIPFAKIPFKGHDLSDFFPGFDAELEGKKVTVHVDTGGTFLHMSPEQAKKLGIKLVEGPRVFASTKWQKCYLGIAKRFRMGKAVLENVPVVALPELTGEQDFIIFGTNILEQFLATLDYPNRRLILSARNDEALCQEHLQMLPAKRVEVPFYMWGDHYMFARGGYGKHKDLNFFIDSGLVYLGVDSQGIMRQACFETTPEFYQSWGVDPNESKKKNFESPLPISLGPLEQENQFFLGSKTTKGFGGVRIHGLLSHAFLKRYAWTLDFSQMRYIFAYKSD